MKTYSSKCDSLFHFKAPNEDFFAPHCYGNKDNPAPAVIDMKNLS